MKKSVLTALSMAGMMAFGLTANASADSYTIKQGDTLTQIAKRFNTNVADLAAVNHIKNVHLIFAGETLEVNGFAKPVAPVAAPKPAVAPAPVVVTPAPVAVPAVDAPAAKPAYQQAQQAPVVRAQQVAPKPQVQAPVVTGGSVYDQFIAAGGTAAMWQHIVMPESTGNPNAISPNGYRGLGQTKEYWGTGSVATQTKGMINYMISRYGSEANALAFRAANGWW